MRSEPPPRVRPLPRQATRRSWTRVQTATELRYGSLVRGWGRPRRLKLEALIGRVEVVHSGPDLVVICAQLRATCQAQGHALAQRGHNADRWIAATAIRLGIPLVSNDKIYRNVPGLDLETAD
jgi:predicted nucleic acid-binding protein